MSHEQPVNVNRLFSPVRPSGLGQMRIGIAGDFAGSGKGGGWRSATATHNSVDGSTTYSYHGAIEQRGQSGRSADFVARERVDTTQRLVWGWVSYGTAVEQTFHGPDGGWVRIRHIVKIESVYRHWATGYHTTVTTAKGEEFNFVTTADGVVTSFDSQCPFLYA